MAAEDEALVSFDPDRREPQLGFVEIAVIAPLFHRNIDERTILTENPTMIIAHERLGAAAVSMTDLVAAVRAGIDERLQRTVRLPRQDDTVLSHVRRNEVLRFGN